eukprot:CAMPEP_0184344094 /NCGR_PEP_ID=MMETSP1089-20130417/12605_1 /TAXON_ID=38269 ORGANISM="Gloeochaete wittrockiana, Strain SAG46.84" /NCGR_SAMPLE_ID=MMETSP1089 /ASSEMBLY_ACC=CAM_ASM_000445 /LENGTH=187 /DNA_ID=CAMNT_0026673747 /DNA_START=31 /DNA_END=594 /DNA_ORIENTATION=-
MSKEVPRRKWAFELNQRSGTGNLPLETQTSSGVKHVNILEPIGYSKNISSEEETRQPSRQISDSLDLKIKKVREVAFSPIKSLVMTGFMLWMSGNSVNLFSLIMTFMALSQYISGIFNASMAFQQFQGMKDLPLTNHKIIFMSLQMCGVLLAFYKCWSIGLLPFTKSDWVTVLPIRKALEVSFGGIA